MARRPRRRVTALLLAVVATACSTNVGTGPGAAPSPLTTETIPGTSRSSSVSLVTTTTWASSSTSSPAEEMEVVAEVVVPEGDGPFPAVVLVHGGGWVAGDPSLMDPLADYLNTNSFLTVNTRYTLAGLENAGFPRAVEDVACAVRFAAAHPDSDGSVAVIGHSVGAHIAALVALTGDEYDAGCPFPGTGVPDRFVGLAGPYDISRLGPAVTAFFGGGPDELPEAWQAGNPQLHTDANAELESLIMHGQHDGLVPESFAVDFHQALVDSGSDALIELVEGARHNDMHDPALVGDLIVTWLER